MNIDIILQMIQPYLVDGAITYDEFEAIFSMLSKTEKYEIVQILIKENIDLIDSREEIELEDDSFDDDYIYDEFNYSDNVPNINVEYDVSIFQNTSIGFVETSKNRTIKQSNETLCKLIQDGNEQAGIDLCIKNELLVEKYVQKYKRFFGHHLAEDDLRISGMLGLVIAAQKFDFSFDNAFSTYAVYWIQQQIIRDIYDNGFTVRIPVHMMEFISKVMKLDKDFFELNYSFEERLNLIARELSCSTNKVKDAIVIREQYLHNVSIDAPIGEDKETSLLELVEIPNNLISPEKYAFHEMLREELEAKLFELTDREEKVLRLRFGFDDGCDRTLEEIGEEFNVTRERIRQIEAKALRKLKHPSRSGSLKDFLESIGEE